MGKRFWHWLWGHPIYPRPQDGTERCGCGAMLRPWPDGDPTNRPQQNVAEKAKDIDTTKEAT